MDFGIFYEITVPKPWTERSESEAYQQVFTQVELAEEVGFSHFWTVEHHFLSEFSHCSAPEVLYGAISQRTKKIRICHGAVLLPFPYNHPIRVAERIATLDIISGGRVEFGTARSISLIELDGFGIPPEETRPRYLEALDVITTIWKNDGKIAYDGKYFKIPERLVVPRPVQKPHPPIWVAATGEESHQIAGSLGCGVLSFTLLVSPEVMGERIKLYKQTWDACAKPIGAQKNYGAASFTLVHCAETDKEARQNAEESILWYVRYAWDLIIELAKKGQTPSYAYTKQMYDMDINQVTFDYLDQNGMIVVGSPETCIKKIKRCQANGMTQLLCFMEAYKIPHQKVMDSIRLFGKHVIPYFK